MPPFDSKMMVRTVSDINGSFAGTIPELCMLPKNTINVGVSGMSYHLWHADKWERQPAERAELLLEHPDFVVWLSELLPDSHTCRHIRRQGVVAAMFGSWQKSKAKATEFWAAVRDESGPSAENPDRKLSRYLLTTSSNRGEGSRRVRRADAKEFYAKSIHAWNAWRGGEPTMLRYSPEAKPPTIK